MVAGSNEKEIKAFQLSESVFTWAGHFKAKNQFQNNGSSILCFPVLLGFAWMAAYLYRTGGRIFESTFPL